MKLTTIHAAFEQWLDQSSCFKRIIWQGTEVCDVACPFATLNHAPGAQTRLDACRTRIDGRFLVSIYLGGNGPDDCTGTDAYTGLELVDCLLCAVKAEGYLVIETANPLIHQVLHLYSPATRGGRATLPRARPPRKLGNYTVHDVDIPYTTISCEC